MMVSSEPIMNSASVEVTMWNSQIIISHGVVRSVLVGETAFSDTDYALFTGIHTDITTSMNQYTCITSEN